MKLEKTDVRTYTHIEGYDLLGLTSVPTIGFVGREELRKYVLKFEEMYPEYINEVNEFLLIVGFIRFDDAICDVVELTLLEHFWNKRLSMEV